MYLKRAVEEIEDDDTSEEKKELIEKAWKMAEDLGAFCVKCKIGSFEISPTEGRFTFFSQKDLPHALNEFNQKKTAPAKKELIKKAATDGGNLINFCVKNEIGGFETENEGDAIVYAPRPF